MDIKPCLKRHIARMNTSRQYMAHINKNAGICDSYLHCASLITNDTVISIGMNVRNKTPRGLHAEVDAITKPRKKQKRRIITDILVIRVSGKNNKLSESRPCRDCILSMYNNTTYKIRNVMYSTRDGLIITERLNNMVKELSTAHVTRNKTPVKN